VVFFFLLLSFFEKNLTLEAAIDIVNTVITLEPNLLGSKVLYTVKQGVLKGVAMHFFLPSSSLELTVNTISIALATFETKYCWGLLCIER
jgi:hypothetical protein